LTDTVRPLTDLLKHGEIRYVFSDARIPMKHFQFRHWFAAATALTALSLTGAAFAQYVWLDEKNVKQYSDMPPPSSIPANRILKQPSGAPAAAPTQAASSTAGVSAPAKTELTAAEKNAEFRKRKAEQVEKEKKSADEARLAEEKAKHCERAREYNRTLESGERISRADRNGERSYLSDEQRAKEMRETRRMLEDCK
jgi:hypothetical protein